MNLDHAPCGGAAGLDGGFPYPDGSIGAWGYDFEGGSGLGLSLITIDKIHYR